MATAAVITGVSLATLVIFGGVVAAVMVLLCLTGYGCWFRWKMSQPYRILLSEAKDIRRKHEQSKHR